MTVLAVSTIEISVNGKRTPVHAPPIERLSKFLREELGLTGTKVGCEAGDCGACTVLIGGKAACSCLIAVGQLDGAEVTTVEGLPRYASGFERLRTAFLQNGAAQCGICTPGMLVSATALLESNPHPNEEQVLDALGGVLCRCTGYRKIVAAVLEAAGGSRALELNDQGGGVGSRAVRVDGSRKVSGTEIYGADEAPADSLSLRVIRCPHNHARFRFGDFSSLLAAHPGIHAVFTAKDVPGKNCFGVIPDCADQPVFAETEARYRGEAVAAIVGDADAIESFALENFPVTWEELPALTTIEAALESGAPLIHAHRAENVLVRGRVVHGDVEAALKQADAIASIEVDTGFVEHACIEPEAGFARRVGDRIEVQSCTQAPYMARKDIAAILGMPETSVRILPTAVGGGFGTKLDLSVQPFLAVAAWHLRRAVRMTYSRPESMMATTKRHPAHMRARAGAARDGKLLALDFQADFNTGAYASWGPTVAYRVPIHASGPYRVPNYRALTRAIHTHLVPAGAFRGFGVPQATIAQEQLYDELAGKLGMDALEFRILNALEDSSANGHGPSIRQRRGHSRMLRSAAAEMDCRAGCIGGCEFRRHRPDPPRRRRCWNVVWLRQYIAAESFDDSRGTETRRPHRAASGRCRYWPGLGHRRHADLRRNTWRAAREFRSAPSRYGCDPGLRQDVRLSPNFRVGQSSEPRRRGIAESDFAARECMRLRGN